MPSCYSTCAFYTPRRDLKCRRFDRGLEAVRTNGASDVRGLRVAFRQWGKLEASGRARALPVGRARTLAAADDAVAGLIGAIAGPHRARDVAAIGWNRVKTHIADRVGSTALDAFLMECVSGAPQETVFTLTVKPEVSTGRYFQRHVTVQPGYNRLSVDAAEIAALVDLQGPLLFQVEPVSPPAESEFVFTQLQFVRWSDQATAGSRPAATPSSEPAAAAKPAKKVKCVVWDLDNTLWRGTLIEDGLEKLELNPVAVAAIKALDSRGILHSIASKNNADDAMAALAHFGLDEYFLAPQIAWRPKSEAIDRIAARLNIHKNSFLFIDDQPFERAEVQSVHEDVRVVSDDVIGDLLGLPELDAPVTDEARNRRSMYKVEEVRESALEQSGGDFIEFLKSCQLVLTIDKITDANIARVFELSQRTNQLNYAGRSSSREDVEALASGKAEDVGLVLSCSDRFGDYGVIGFAVVNPKTFHVGNFFMSCRVQHKKVDHAFFGWLIEQAARSGRSHVTVSYRFSGRNQSARQVLDEMRFSPSGEAEVLQSPGLSDLPDHDVVAIVDKAFPATPAVVAVA
ncbi:MAG: HAD-IIIC family phosphatase [Caulobacteraceae bacterium]|nr:HAD-IIIC family phosphatase [Caulobacteraceae bacterium]